MTPLNQSRGDGGRASARTSIPKRQLANGFAPKLMRNGAPPPRLSLTSPHRNTEAS